MQKKIIALAIAGLASSAAFAQTNVTIYGILDASAYAADTNNHRTQFGFLSNAVSSSRLGFKGTEDLGNGLKALFNLETELSLVSGAMGSSTSGAGAGNFTRAANVGFDSKFGTLTLGRQATPMYSAVTASDALGANSGGLINAWVYSGLLTSSNRVLGAATGVTASGLNGVALPNAYFPGVGYASPVFGGFQAKVFTNFGNNQTDEGFDTHGLRDIVLSYSGFGANVRAGYQEQLSAVSQTGHVNVKNTLLAADYTIAGLKVAGAFAATKWDNPLAVSDINTWTLGASYQMGRANVGMSYTDTRGVTQGTGENNAAKQVALLAKYSLSKRTDVYALATHVNNEGSSRMTGLYTGANIGSTDTIQPYNSQWSANPTSLALGVRHMF